MKRILPALITAAFTVLPISAFPNTQIELAEFTAESGEKLWNQTQTVSEQPRSCASCHTSDPRQAGKHVRTGKPIKPMAPSVNSDRFTDPKKVAKSTNLDVVREYQLNLKALAQEKAIQLSDKGKKKEAVKELKQSVARLKQAGSRYKDEELLKQANELEVQADMIEDQGMSKKSRKLLRTESYQKKNQQLSQ